MGTDVSITAGTVKFTFQASGLDKCESNIISNIETNEMPILGPMNNQLFDFNGPAKTITVMGQLTAALISRTTIGGVATTTTIKTVLEQKKWLESLISGNQSPMTFTSNYESQSANASQTPSTSDPYASSFTNTTVMVESLKFPEEEGVGEGDNAYLPFTLSLKVGTF